MQIKNIIKTVVDIAHKYQEKLENKNILFIYLEHSSQKINYIETKFLSRNFLHLTGLNFSGKHSNYFYKLCLNNKIKSKDIEIRNQKLIQMKLEILNNLAFLDKKVRILGQYNNSKLRLNTDMIIGNINWGLGFIQDNGFYVPNTLLKDDIRDIIINSNRVICIMSKKIQDKEYNKIDYLVKDFEIQNIINTEDLKNKIALKYDKNLLNRQY